MRAEAPPGGQERKVARVEGEVMLRFPGFIVWVVIQHTR